MKKMIAFALLVRLVLLTLPPPVRAEWLITEEVMDFLGPNGEAVLIDPSTAIAKWEAGGYYAVGVCQRLSPDNWSCHPHASNGNFAKGTLAPIKTLSGEMEGAVWRTNANTIGVLRWNGSSWQYWEILLTVDCTPSAALTPPGELVVAYTRDYGLYLHVEGEGEIQIPLFTVVWLDTGLTRIPIAPNTPENHGREAKLVFASSKDGYLALERYVLGQEYPMIWWKCQSCTWQLWQQRWNPDDFQGPTPVEVATDAEERLVVANEVGYWIFGLDPFGLHLEWGDASGDVRLAHDGSALQFDSGSGAFHRRDLYQPGGESDFPIPKLPQSPLVNYGLMAERGSLEWYQIGVEVREVAIDGPDKGVVNFPYTFTGSVNDDATTPVNWLWQATGQSPISHPDGGLEDAVQLTLNVTGTMTLTVTASNDGGGDTAIHTITISPTAPIYLPIILKNFLW